MSGGGFGHYFRPCPYDSIDVYRVLLVFGVTDPALQHAIKKLLVAGGRGGGKDVSVDVTEAIAALQRWRAMREEEREAAVVERMGKELVERDMVDRLRSPREAAAQMVERANMPDGARIAARLRGGTVYDEAMTAAREAGMALGAQVRGQQLVAEGEARIEIPPMQQQAPELRSQFVDERAEAARRSPLDQRFG